MNLDSRSFSFNQGSSRGWINIPKYAGIYPAVGISRDMV